MKKVIETSIKIVEECGKYNLIMGVSGGLMNWENIEKYRFETQEEALNEGLRIIKQRWLNNLK